MNLSSLSLTDKTRLAAQLDGRLDLYNHILNAWSGNEGTMAVVLKRARLDYATSYDDIIPLIQKQSYQMQKRIYDKLPVSCLLYTSPSPRDA